MMMNSVSFSRALCLAKKTVSYEHTLSPILIHLGALSPLP
jgi:hypothetical protein